MLLWKSETEIQRGWRVGWRRSGERHLETKESAGKISSYWGAVVV